MILFFFQKQKNRQIIVNNKRIRIFDVKFFIV